MSVADVKLGATRKFWRNYGIGYLFVLPAFLLLLVFMVYPFFTSIYYSLTNWNGVSATKTFIGLQNYINLVRDPIFWKAIQHNALWMVVGSASAIGTGLFLAIMIWDRPKGFLFFRTVFFLPQVLGAGILGVLWNIVYQPRRGLLYLVGDAWGIDAFKSSPLASYELALWAIIFAAVWASIGFYFVIFVAGLQNINMELIDAAHVDGADSWQRFIHIIIPQLAHVLTLVITLALIGSIKVFGIVWAMTQGGPANGSEVLATYAYRQFSALGNVGYSSSITLVLAAFALTATVVVLLLRERNEE